MRQRGVWAMVAARWRHQQLLVGLLVVVLIATLTAPGGAAADEVQADPGTMVEEVEEFEAAPAVAARLLADAGVAARYGRGRAAGNHIADVATRMAASPATEFDGVAASDTVAYECAVARFLRAGTPAAMVSISACATVPNSPVGLQVTSGNGQLVITWRAPEDSDETCTVACDAPVTSYTVTLQAGDDTPVILDTVDLSVVAEGLTNGTSYNVSVVATNRIGDSAPATDTGTPEGDALTFTAISAGNFHTCAIADGAAYCWGFGSDGRLGNNSTVNSSVPVAVATRTEDGVGASVLPAGAEVTAISAGSLHTCAIADGAAYCWGFGSNGQLGNNSTVSSSVPVAVATISEDGVGASVLPAGAEVTAISVGNFHTCAIADGAAYCWGFGSDGQLGNNSTVDSSVPVAVLAPAP